MKTILHPLIAALFAALAALPAAALTPDERAVVARVEDYLNSVKTLQSKFVQAAPDGRQATGAFYLSRPGKMRLVYDPPVEDFVVADGRMLFYWDSEMEQDSSAPIGSTLADVILRENLKLSGDVTVTDVARQPGVVEVTLHETKDPGKGQITLVFEDRPLVLRQWRVRDAQGLVTTVGLLNPAMGVALDPGMFYFRRPVARPNPLND